MWVYNLLSKIGLLKNYHYKILFITIPGILIPVFVILFYQWSQFPTSVTIGYLSFLLILSVFSIGMTGWLLSELTEPISLANSHLKRYLETNKVPDPPLGYNDEVGNILRNLKLGAMKAQKLVNEKNDFTAMLSHDLRSPMVSIIGLLKLIRSHQGTDQAEFYCRKAEEFGYHQLNLMESILSLLNEENQPLSSAKKVNVNLSKILALSLSQFEMTLENKQVEINQNIPPQLEVNVEPYSFSQVLSNLLHNAIKFSKKGDCIEVDANNGGDMVNIIVKDQGIGFALDNPNVLFQRFTPERKRGTQGEPTNGLGLYLSKKIIEKHDGSISAESDGNNKGATFRVFIPN